MRNLRKFIIAGIAVITLAMGIIVIAGLNDHVASADLIIVPGNTVAPDGTPSPRLQSRLDAALHLFRLGHAPRIFVSGGIGKEGFDEAAVMAKYLESHGVPMQAIVKDNLGADTAATARNAAAYMRASNLHTALVATQYFHVPRTRLALERQGIHVAGAVHGRYFELRDIYSTLRETVAYVTYYAKR